MNDYPPNPGSDAAVALGCLCPRMDNGYGDPARREFGGWVIAEGCTVHPISPTQVDVPDVVCYLCSAVFVGEEVEDNYCYGCQEYICLPCIQRGPDVSGPHSVEEHTCPDGPAGIPPGGSFHDLGCLGVCRGCGAVCPGDPACYMCDVDRCCTICRPSDAEIIEDDGPIPPHLSVAEFRRLGYLQEVNRLILHPLGLAIEVTIDRDGTERLSGIWDHRDDPAGIVFGGPVDLEKVRHVWSEFGRRLPARFERLGYYVQPETEPAQVPVNGTCASGAAGQSTRYQTAVTEALDNGRENGFDMVNEDPHNVAVELGTYCPGFEGMEPAVLMPYIERWQQGVQDKVPWL